MNARLGLMVVVPLLYAVPAGIWGFRLLTPEPVKPEPAKWIEVPGRVVEVRARPCSAARPSRGTCFRPAAEYTVDGVTRQVAARSVSRTPAHSKGDAVIVLHDAARTAEPWLKPEFERKQQYADAERARERRARILWAILMFGTSALSVLLVVGVISAHRAPPAS